MKRSKPLFYLGTAALLSLASLGTISAQEVGQAKVPQSLLLQKDRLSPSELQARQAENRAKHPLLYQRRYLAPSLKSSDGLTRLKDGAPTAIPTAPAVSNRVMRPAQKTAANSGVMCSLTILGQDWAPTTPPTAGMSLWHKPQ